MPQRDKRPSGAAKPAAFPVRVTTRAKVDEVTEVTADGLVKIRLKAPPVEGKANQALLNLLARLLDTPASQIVIVSGFSSRDKLVLVTGRDAKTALRRLREAISTTG